MVQWSKLPHQKKGQGNNFLSKSAKISPHFFSKFSGKSQFICVSGPDAPSVFTFGIRHLDYFICCQVESKGSSRAGKMANCLTLFCIQLNKWWMNVCTSDLSFKEPHQGLFLFILFMFLGFFLVLFSREGHACMVNKLFG